MIEDDAIFAAAGRFSERVHKIARGREIQAELLSGNRCGACNFWMTNSCPREVDDNSGIKKGPSCKALACSKYSEKSWDTERKQRLRDELEKITKELSP